MSIVSPHAENLGKRLLSLDMQNGDMSYRMEGICQAISDVRDTLSGADRIYLVDAIYSACKTFRQVTNDGMVLNRFALQTTRDMV